MYAAIRMRQSAQRVCLQLVAQHPMLLRPTTRHARTFQSFQCLRLDDTTDKNISETPVPEAETTNDKPANKVQSQTPQDFESVFKNAAREDSFKTKAQAPSAWVTDDFGFGGSVPSYLDDASYQKPSAARKKKDRKKARQEAYVKAAEETNEAAPWDNDFAAEFQHTTSQKPTLNSPGQIPSEPFEDVEAATEADNNLSPEELELKREFARQRQDYERTKDEPMTHQRSKHARPHRWHKNRDLQPRSATKKPRKKAWVVEMEKIITKGLMFDAQGQPIVQANSKPVQGEANEENPERDTDDTSGLADIIKELGAIPREAQMEDAGSRTLKFRNARHRISLMSEPIGKSMLGAPAHAIMMRDSYLPKRVEIPTEVMDVTPPSRKELEEQIAEYKNTATLEEVSRNLDELRPVVPVLSYEDFMQLRLKISSSFLERHLLNYIDENFIKCVLSPKTKHMRESENIDYTWINGPVTWIPETILDTDNMTQKDRLVMNILLRGWKLKIQEEEFGQGRLDVHVQSGAVELLLSSKTAIVPRLKQLLMNPNDKVRFIEAEHRLSITASHALSLTLLEKINELASRMRGGVIPLELFGNRRLEPAEVNFLASITTSWINMTPVGARVPAAMVGWIEENNPTAGIESIKHVITRLMYSAVVPPAETTTDLVEGEDGAVLMEAHGDRKQRNWKNRMGQVMRLVAPMQKILEAGAGVEAATAKAEVDSEVTTEAAAVAETESTTELIESEPEVTAETASEAAADATAEVAAEATAKALPALPALPASFQNSLRWPISEPSQDSASGWSPLTTRTNAVFGHLLHPKPADLTSAFTAPTTLPSPSFLAPVIPHISSLATIPLNNFDAPSNESHTLIVHFSASPQSLPASFTATPPKLELHFSLPIAGAHERITWANSAKHLIAVWATHHSNMMLPRAAVDVQVAQHRIQTLAGDALHESEPLRAFVDASTLDLSHGTLRTPPAVQFSLPLINLDGAPVEPGLTDIQFLFMGLELRESFMADFHGHVLKHSLVEAGYHGGTRTEMALEPAAQQGDTDADNFLRTVYAMAVGHYFPWHKRASSP